MVRLLLEPVNQVRSAADIEAEGGGAKQGLAAGKGVREIARLSGISPASVCRIKNSMNTEVARP